MEISKRKRSMRRETRGGRYSMTGSSNTFVLFHFSRFRGVRLIGRSLDEQNIRVVATYYTRITLSRLSSFLNLPIPQTEQFLSSLVTSKTVYAKIDRPAGIVNFVKPKKGDEVLNEWSSDVGKLMGLIEKSCHLIAKVGSRVSLTDQ